MKNRLVVLLSTLLFVGACSTAPKLTYDWHSFNKGFSYDVFYKIPNSDFYAKANSVRESVAREKAKARALDIGLHEFSEKDFEFADRNENQIIEWSEEKELMRNKYDKEHLKKGVYKEGTYINGKLVK